MQTGFGMISRTIVGVKRGENLLIYIGKVGEFFAFFPSIQFSLLRFHFPTILLLVITCNPLLSCFLLNLKLEFFISPTYKSKYIYILQFLYIKAASLAVMTVNYMPPKPVCMKFNIIGASNFVTFIFFLYYT